MKMFTIIRTCGKRLEKLIGQTKKKRASRSSTTISTRSGTRKLNENLEISKKNQRKQGTSQESLGKQINHKGVGVVLL